MSRIHVPTGNGYLLSRGQRIATARRGGRASGIALYRIGGDAYTMDEIATRTGLSKARVSYVIHCARRRGRVPAWTDFPDGAPHENR